MVRREKCPQCNKDVEVDKEIIIENPYEITIHQKCGHRLGGLYHNLFSRRWRQNAEQTQDSYRYLVKITISSH